MIKILIVEDEPNKCLNIQKFIKSKFSSVDITTCESISTAKNALQTKVFDLVLLDLMLPMSSWLSPSRTGGLTLLDFIQTDDRCLSPRYVVGVTGFEDIANEQRINFESKTWCIIKYESTALEWRNQLETILLYIDKIIQQENQTTFQTDILFITALRNPEFKSVLDLPVEWDSALIPVGGQNFLKRGLTKFEDKKISVIASCTARMGMVWTSLLVDRIIREFRPRVVVMCGICMGLPDDTSMGDLVLGMHSWNWQAGKLTADKNGQLEFKVQPEPVVATELITNLWNEFNINDLSRLHLSFEGKRPNAIPKLHIAPMVSGSSVVANCVVHPDITKQDRKIRGVDMETFGVYAACNSATNPKPKFFSLKAVSDFGDIEKEDDFQNYCAYMSAHTAFLFLSKYWSNII